MTVRILHGHVLDVLRGLPGESVHCVVTSPPYYGLRDYKIPPQVWGGEAGCEHEWGDATVIDGRHLPELEPSLKQATNAGSHQRGIRPGAFCTRCRAWRGSLGLEPTLALYLDHMIEIVREVRRVMRKDATCWLNIGDSYNSSGNSNASDKRAYEHAHRLPIAKSNYLKPKDLLLVPWRLVIRLQEDGWWVRSPIAWCKRAPMPESCTDRPTSAWEPVFLLTKSARYFYDAEAVKEEAAEATLQWSKYPRYAKAERDGKPDFLQAGRYATRNLRNVWLLGPSPFPDAHFATFPPEIPRRAILAGCPKGGTVLDPFLGAGTTALVADRLGRDCVGIELSAQYVTMARRRIADDAGMFADIAQAAE